MRGSKARVMVVLSSFAALVLGISPSAAHKTKTGGRYAPTIIPAEFVTKVDNPYFPLVPGTRLVYHEVEDGKTFVNEITVLPETKSILGVACTVVHDVLMDGNTMKEDTYDWYAQDKKGNVWYFGEDTKEFLPNGAVNTEGSWQSGVGKNQPGIIMPGHTVPGAPYRQEYGPGHAEDMGQVEAVNQFVSVPAGSFSDCVRTKEWSLLEAGTENKWYAKGVGCIKEKGAKTLVTLMSVTKP